MKPKAKTKPRLVKVKKVLTPEEKAIKDARAAARLETGLRNFKLLPEEALVRLNVVRALKGCSMASVWRWSKLGHLPPIESISPKTSGMRAGLLRQCLANSGNNA